LTLLIAGAFSAEALIGLGRPAEAQDAGASAKAAAAAALTGKARAQGNVNVIVGLPLATRFLPEAALSHAEIASQRSDIANNRATLLADLRGWGATEYASWPTLPFVALKVDLPALQRLASSPLVASIQEDGLSRPQLASSTALIGADVTVASGFRGDDWAVVILDTGIDTNHPFFSGRVVSQACFSNGAGGGQTLCPAGGNTQFGPGAAEVTDGAGNPIPACNDGSGNQICDHGSHVTGIAAGEDSPANPQGFNGVAPDAFIIAIQIFTGSPRWPTALPIRRLVCGRSFRTRSAP
jgi:subtilisin